MEQNNTLPFEPNSIYTYVKPDLWKSYIVFSNEDSYIAFEFDMDEFSRKANEIAEVLRKGGSIAETLVTMRNEGSTLSDMDKELYAIHQDGGL